MGVYVADSDWRPIKSWIPDDGERVLGYWQYRDRAGRRVDGWGVIKRTKHGWKDLDGICNDSLYTHFMPLTRPKEDDR